MVAKYKETMFIRQSKEDFLSYAIFNESANQIKKIINLVPQVYCQVVKIETRTIDGDYIYGKGLCTYFIETKDYELATFF